MLDILEKAARAGGDVLKKYFRTNITTTHKTSHHNIVTQADIESQDIIKEILLEKMQQKGIAAADVGFIGEENLFGPSTKYTFIIDPLDGTSNFTCGIPYFCTVIALAENQEITKSVIYNPITENFFFAEKGRGACMRSSGSTKDLHDEDKSLKARFLNTHFSSNEPIRNKMYDYTKKMFPLFLSVRVTGSIANDLCNLANNASGAVMGGAMLWDIAAGRLIIEEAGGVMVDWNGDPLIFNFKNPDKRYQFLATHSNRLEEIITQMKQ